MHERLTIDSTLQEWDAIKADFENTAIFIGNGASRAVWDGFAYSSLLELAFSNKIEHPLTEIDQKLFDEFETENFERVLAALNTAKIVNRYLGIEYQPVSERYEAIRTSLAESVRRVHIAWEDITRDVMEEIKQEIKKYRFVFSLNYDLLIYWAIMHNPPGEGFTDYFFESPWFNRLNTKVWNREVTRVLYLHGGLHLYRTEDGSTLKRERTDRQSLLELFGTPFENDAVPLIVTEGTHTDKLAVIRQSDYLWFAYEEFKNYDGPLVLFGTSLGHSDQHIIDAIRSHSDRRIAISVASTDHQAILTRKTEIGALLGDQKVVFFRARSHPLGNPNLKVTV